MGNTSLETVTEFYGNRDMFDVSYKDTNIEYVGGFASQLSGDWMTGELVVLTIRDYSELSDYDQESQRRILSGLSRTEFKRRDTPLG